MLEALFQAYKLRFKQPAGTSRGVLHEKPTWFIILRQGRRTAVGECGMFPGLSADDRPDFEAKLRWTCENIQLGEEVLTDALSEFPAIRFGVEMAFRGLQAARSMALFSTPFSRGQAAIPINGLVWMGDPDFMRAQLRAHIQAGFSCVKLKIGALDFDVECDILRQLRRTFSPHTVELRLDANGAFPFGEALEKLERLSKLGVHSVEQPIKAGNWRQMAELCARTPVPIALDEELIGLHTAAHKASLLERLKPQYIVLKPSLVGGFSACEGWIRQATTRRVGWWITSALESNIGLNAIAQWTATLHNPLPQGLGTGGLFTNNIPAPLRVSQGGLHISAEAAWDLSQLGV